MKECKRYSFFVFLCILALCLLPALSAGAEAQYGQVNYNQVRLRKQMESTDAWIKLNTGDIVQILNTHSYNGTAYYYVTCHHPSHPEREYWGYIDQRYVNPISAAQAMSAAQATAAPAATALPQADTANTVYYAPAVTAAPQTDTAAAIQAAAAVQAQAVQPSGGAVGSIQFTARGVNLRKRPSAEAKVLGRFEKDQIIAYYGTTSAEGHTWYQVSNGIDTGYVMGDYVKKVGASAPAATASPAADASTATAAAAVSSGDSAAAVTAAAQSGVALTNKEKVIVRAAGNAKGTQIKLLNRANQVCTLLGPTSTADGYTWYNVHVKDIDGWIRGDLLRILSASEAAAYDQTPSGSSAGASGATLYAPEIADWNTSSIQSIFYKGCVATVTDVKTGISFQVKRWSGGSHADVEPLTAGDTAAICRIYGVTSASDITENKNYQRRSILVTISGHSYAASMYGVPHNVSEGNTIKDNNYTGQFCIHFTNSTTHGSKKVDADHQNAIDYAYNNAVTQLTGLGYTFQ